VDEKPFYEATRGSLPGYTESHELWVETLVVHYKKKIGGNEIDIGIRAPLKLYGHAFRIWFRINGVHFYPVSPYKDTSTGETAWVYRVYHTPGWKDNLVKRLEYLRNIEGQAIRVVDAACRLKLMDVKNELVLAGISAEEAEEILSNWTGGSLWDLVSIIPDRRHSLAILVKHGLLAELSDK
jgi:hypothetical protein